MVRLLGILVAFSAVLAITEGGLSPSGLRVIGVVTLAVLATAQAWYRLQATKVTPWLALLGLVPGINFIALASIVAIPSAPNEKLQGQT
jgi:hypothetical protein